MMKMINKNLFIHVGLILSFLLIPYVLVRDSLFFLPDFVDNPHERFTLLVYLLMIVFFYLNYYLLIPVFYLTKSYVKYAASLFVGLLLILIIYFSGDKDGHPLHFHLLHFAHPHMHPHGPMRMHKPPPGMFTNQLLFLFIVGVLVGLYLRVKSNWESAMKERQHSELNNLKAQINPHFLFNTFNSIYALAIREHADKTAHGMLKLSGMMRYAVTETHKDFVPLDKEVSYITDFIELQKLRLDKGVRLEYEVIGSCADKQISPLLLIPFIENAFKHGVNPDEDSSIQIHLRIQEESLELHVVNHKVSLGASVHEMMGIGIENTRNRLTYLYPGKHSLEIKETSSQYSVTLILQCI